jgi:hypothetical protein
MTQISQTGFKRDITGNWISKDPGATLQYSIDWSDWLPTGDTISTSTFVQESTHTANVTLSGTSTANGVTSVVIAGGAAGQIYTIRNTIVTADNNTDVRRFRIRVENRYL